VDAQSLFEEIGKRGMRERYFVANKDDIARELMTIVRPGDMVITLGAGDIYRAGEQLLELLRRRDEKP
jgi:UDP-N-acetylmuramate--alanine ligase